MTALPTEKPTRSDTGDPSLVHFICRACSPHTGLCGTDRREVEETDDDAECVVCISLAEEQYPICARCGWDWRRVPNAEET